MDRSSVEFQYCMLCCVWGDSELERGISSLVLDTQNCLGCCLQRSEDFENVLAQNGPRGTVMNSRVIRVNNLVWERALRKFDFWDGEQWYPSPTPPVHTHSGHPCVHLIGHLTCPSCDFRASIALHGHLPFSPCLFPPFLWPCTHIMSPVFLIFRSQQAHGHLKAVEKDAEKHLVLRQPLKLPGQWWSPPPKFGNEKPAANLYISKLLVYEYLACWAGRWPNHVHETFDMHPSGLGILDHDGGIPHLPGHLLCSPHRPMIVRY